jgi:hypothetical protein
MNAVVAATVARLISEGGGVNTGVHFLMDAVDPVTFMEELRNVGVSQMESFGAGGCEPRAEGAAP